MNLNDDEFGQIRRQSKQNEVCFSLLSTSIKFLFVSENKRILILSRECFFNFFFYFISVELFYPG